LNYRVFLSKVTKAGSEISASLELKATGETIGVRTMSFTKVLLVNWIPNYIGGSPVMKVLYELLRQEKPALLRVTLKD
jgi:hypothetical protein